MKTSCAFFKLTSFSNLTSIILFMGFLACNDKKIENSNTKVTSDSFPKVTSSSLQIDIQNGTGVSNVSDKIAKYLRSKGYDVVEIGNFSISDVKTTMVIDRAGNMKGAKQVAITLGIKEEYVIQQLNKNYFLDATVVIGKDYELLNPFKENKKETEDEQKNKNTEKNLPQINAISAQDLLEEYEGNQIRADKKYLNKKIQVEGVIYKISKSPTDYSIIEIEGESGSIKSIKCALLKSQDKKALQYSKGDRIIINGKCCGKPENLGFSDIVFVDCIIVQ